MIVYEGTWNGLAFIRDQDGSIARRSGTEGINIRIEILYNAIQPHNLNTIKCFPLPQYLTSHLSCSLSSFPSHLFLLTPFILHANPSILLHAIALRLFLRLFHTASIPTTRPPTRALATIPTRSTLLHSLRRPVLLRILHIALLPRAVILPRRSLPFGEDPRVAEPIRPRVADRHRRRA